MEFTIIISSDKYTYDRNKYITTFPESMIALALQDPDADYIELTNPCVTPNVLKYLDTLLSSDSHSSLPPSEQDMTLASRYLLIPLLSILSDSNYVTFHKLHPHINILNIDHLNMYYGVILQHGILNKFHLLAQYLLDTVDITTHQVENWSGLYATAYMNNVNLYHKLYSNVKNPCQLMCMKMFEDLTQFKGNDNVEHYIRFIDNISLIEVASLGEANDILSLLVKDKLFRDIEYDTDDTVDEQSRWDVSCVINMFNNNILGIDIIHSLCEIYIINVLIEQACDDDDNLEMIGHLLYGKTVDDLPRKLFLHAIHLEGDEYSILKTGVNHMTDQELLDIIETHLNDISSRDMSNIVFIGKFKRKDFLLKLYDIVLKNKRFYDIRYWETLLPLERIWTDILVSFAY